VGERADHIVAFARRNGNEVAITVAPRLCSGLVGDSGLVFQSGAWKDIRVALPENAGGAFRSVFTGERVETEERGGMICLPVSGLLQDFPVALLTADSPLDI